MGSLGCQDVRPVMTAEMSGKKKANVTLEELYWDENGTNQVTRKKKNVQISLLQDVT